MKGFIISDGSKQIKATGFSTFQAVEQNRTQINKAYGLSTYSPINVTSQQGDIIKASLGDGRIITVADEEHLKRFGISKNFNAVAKDSNDKLKLDFMLGEDVFKRNYKPF